MSEITNRYNNGRIKEIIHYDNDKLIHNDNGPAYLKYYENGNICIEKYCIHNKLSRVNGPTIICHFLNSRISKELYYINGKLHREDGPAIIEYFDDKKSTISCESYFIDGKNWNGDNGDKPSVIKYFCFGKDEKVKVYEKYMSNNKPHREYGPAIIEYDRHGNIIRECYYKNGDYHREDGPAVINYLYHDEDNRMTDTPRVLENYYLFDKFIELEKKQITFEDIQNSDSIDYMYILKLSLIGNKNKYTNYNELIDLIESKIITLKLCD